MCIRDRYELAIITGAFIEKGREKREWEEWDESIQGPKPPKPKREKSRWILYLVCLLAIGGAAFLYFQNKEEIHQFIKDFPNGFSFSDNKTSDTERLVSETNSSIITTVLIPDSNWSKIPKNQEFLIELTPADSNLSNNVDLNSSGQIYRAILREKK